MSFSLQSPVKKPPCNARAPLFRQKSSRVEEFRLRGRFKVTATRKLAIRSHFGNLISDFVSQFRYVDVIAPALGFTSVLALYVSRVNKAKQNDEKVGEWILFTSPTPFNRFVLLRCPSVSFEDSFVKEDWYSLRLGISRIIRDAGMTTDLVDKFEYQRLCVPTDDGGVISLDYPANLNLGEDHEMDTTLLLVPGVTEGSMDLNVRMFVSHSIRCGFFPVVLNPRGCAGSPLTTPRIFTAADSDDVCKAVQFISKMRTRTAIMGVGWGYGANMLTKYLAEAGEKTPLVAATCIDNPFDLEEVSRTTHSRIDNDQKLLDGFKSILHSNKEIFRGKTKGFDVEKAMQAGSVREFESSISMLSYGFKTIQDFYSECSTKYAVRDIKIPVLFIQSDNGSVPVYSVPHSFIAENFYTSLLLRSSPSMAVASGRVEYHYLAMEWLTAVELGLLKGHDPLLDYVDVGLRFQEESRFKEGGKAELLLDLGQKESSSDNNIDPTDVMLGQTSVATTIISSSGIRSRRYSGPESMRLQQVNSAKIGEDISVYADSMKENKGSAIEADRGQVLQTAEVVLNLLEVAAPGTLAPEQKEKVLTAVGQGETVLKALQNAVPEDAFDKLTTSVSEILHSGKYLKLDGFSLRGQNGEVLSGPKSAFHGKVGETSFMDGYSSQSSIVRAVDLEYGSDATLFSSKPQAKAIESDLHNRGEGKNVVHPQSIDNHEDRDAGSVPKGLVDYVDGGTDIFSKDSAQSDDNEKPAYSDYKESVNVNGDSASSVEAASANKIPIVDQYQDNEDGASPQLAANEENYVHIEEKAKDSSTDRKQIKPPAVIDQAESSSISDPESDVRENEEKSAHLVPENSKTGLSNPSPPGFNLSEAFDALTGMEDSTQVAVNSVFGAIEDMITQYEEKKDDEKQIKYIQDVEDEKSHHANNNYHNIKEKGGNINMQHDEIQDSSTYDYPGDSLESRYEIKNEKVDEMIVQGSSEAEKDISRSVSAQLCNNDWACRSNTSYSAPNKVTNLSENPHSDFYLGHMLPSVQDTNMNYPTSLPLNYSTEEGQSALLDQSGISRHCDKSNSVPGNVYAISNVKEKITDKHLKPMNVIIDNERQGKPIGGNDKDESREHPQTENESVHDWSLCVKSIIMDSLEADVYHRVSASNMKEVRHNVLKDLELVSNVISQAVQELSSAVSSSMIYGTLRAEDIVSTVSFAVQKAHYLRRILPVGVIIGSSLAALKKYFNVTVGVNSAQSESVGNHKLTTCIPKEAKVSKKTVCFHASEGQSLETSENVHFEKNSFQDDSVMAGAVTTALGATALLMQDSYKGKHKTENSMKYQEKKKYINKEPHNLVDGTPESQNNLVTSLAEKAMSVAGPVVPMKKDGAVDQERLVAMLADLGQRFGMLKLVGKAALLWGGIRGAMSLTDKLISFLHLSKRPLLHRVVGFVGMVILLWSPVYIPLLPTLARGWATKSPSIVAELTCIIGMYVAVLILITLWGKRIRGYDRPLEQYGLDFTLPEFKCYLRAYIGGALIILSIQYVNMVIGCASLSWHTCFPSLGLTWLQESGKILLLVAQGTISATGVVLVEELLFRSWLPAEIEKDLGFHLGIIISGFTFSILQRSLNAIPGLWLLSLALAGAKERSQGSLSTPIGLRAGMMASTFVLQKGGFLTYQPEFAVWIKGTHPGQPFSGISGLACSMLLAVFLYPRQPNYGKKVARKIRE
uniref:Embryogenesis-associated protein EMB8 n=1 Tax=Kalanchoe fedtschenkoi TaxID=63787 RepID=A0A7N0RFN1_KALFE